MQNMSHVRVLAALAALGLLLGTGCGRPGKVEVGPAAALGEVAASESANLLGNSGQIVILVSETDKDSSTALGIAFKAFTEALKNTGLKVVATETIRLPELVLSGTDPVPADRFLELVSKHAAVDALISFVGVPRLSAAQITQLPPQRPKIVVAAVFNPPSKMLFAQGVVHLAILPRRATTPAEKPPRTAREWFEANYQVVTPETAGSLPF
jgi:hypothetical protein